MGICRATGAWWTVVKPFFPKFEYCQQNGMNDRHDVSYPKQLTEVSMHHKRASLDVHYWDIDIQAQISRNFQEMSSL